MAYGNSKGVLEVFFAVLDFRLRLLGGNLSQVRMSQGVRSNFVSSGQPFTHFGFIHQSFRRLADSHVPVIGQTEACGYEILDRTESVAGERLKCVSENVLVTVIKGERDPPVLWRSLVSIWRQRNCREPRGA